ncbi:MAG: TolC family protein [Candidatus Cloacimonadales bacterium]|nr:TolC family protein [Candidatus Cloacimonadales bacterium]
MKKIMSIIVLIILPLICVAQQYTLDELINIGLEKSYDIQAEVVNELNAESSLRSSYYGVLPSLSVGLDRTKTYDPTDTEWTNTAELTVSKNFSLNEPSYYSIRTSIYGMKNAQLSMNETRKQIAYYIFSNYLGVLELQETLEIQRKNLELQNKIQLQIQVQFDAGDKSLLELKQSEVSLIDYEIAVNEAINALSKTRKDLFSYLNIDDKGFEFIEPAYSIKLEKTEFQFNNALKQKFYTLENGKLLHFRSMMNFLPTFTIGYGLGQYKLDEVTAFSDYNRNSQSLYLSASWDIFGLLDTYESYSRSKRNLNLQKLEYKTSQRDYGIQLDNLQNDLATLQRSFDLYEEKLKLASENLNMAQEQFRLGMISLLDLDRSKIDFQNTQLARIQKHYQLMIKQEEINLLLSDKILGKW